MCACVFGMGVVVCVCASWVVGVSSSESHILSLVWCKEAPLKQENVKPMII